MFHRIQSDIEIQGRLASDQSARLKEIEDQMVIQQLIAGGNTGGKFTGLKVDGGVRRLDNQGAAVKVEVKASQMADPYVLASSIEWALNGLIAQKVPLGGLKVLLPINEFSVLADYGVISADGVSSSVEGVYMAGLSGKLKSYGVRVVGSQQFTQILASTANDDTNHHLLSNADNGYRYDVTADTQKCRAIIYGRDALLCGRTMDLQSDIFFDKKVKCYFIDTWMSEGAIPDRYDNIAVVVTGTATQAEVLTKAKGKARLFKDALES